MTPGGRLSGEPGRPRAGVYAGRRVNRTVDRAARRWLSASIAGVARALRSAARFRFHSALRRPALSIDQTEIDYLVVGSGSAGAAVAYQLAATGCSVLVAEAGSGYTRPE